VSQFQKKWIADNAIDETKINLNNDQYLTGRNNADSADLPLVKTTTGDEAELGTITRHPFTPTVNEHIANRGYVLDVLAGLRDPKDAVKVASTANVDIATGGLLTIDGVLLVAGDRVLLKNQTTASENGIYVAAAGAWSRSTDADSDPEITQGMSCLVSEGLLNARKVYVLNTPDPIVVDTTALTFAQAPNPANFLIPVTSNASISALDVANGYIDLAHEAENGSVEVTPYGGPEQQQGIDYTLTVVGNVTRVTFAGNLAALIADGDTLLVKYSYATA
jgi:hypothetical protein